MFREAGNAEGSENAGLLCKGNGLDIKQVLQARFSGAARPEHPPYFKSRFETPRSE